ncbi:MAG: hypothetical protein RMM53_13525, partial [Bacteroidia bacterium]|nr:hypothetical protein [Bacteroidia bacterium]
KIADKYNAGEIDEMETDAQIGLLSQRFLYEQDRGDMSKAKMASKGIEQLTQTLNKQYVGGEDLYRYKGVLETIVKGLHPYDKRFDLDVFEFNTGRYAQPSDFMLAEKRNDVYAKIASLVERMRRNESVQDTMVKNPERAKAFGFDPKEMESFMAEYRSENVSPERVKNAVRLILDSDPEVLGYIRDTAKALEYAAEIEKKTGIPIHKEAYAAVINKWAEEDGVLANAMAELFAYYSYSQKMLGGGRSSGDDDFNINKAIKDLNPVSTIEAGAEVVKSYSIAYKNFVEDVYSLKTWINNPNRGEDWSLVNLKPEKEPSNEDYKGIPYKKYPLEQILRDDVAGSVRVQVLSNGNVTVYHANISPTTFKDITTFDYRKLVD